MKYKAIILDIDDTLYDYASLNDLAIGRAVEMAREKYTVTQDEFLAAFSWARNETKKVLKDTGACHNRMLYFQKTLEKLGIPPADYALELYEAYWGYMLEHMQLSEGVTEFLDYCRNANLKIGICSDLTAHIQHRKLRRLGIAHYMDAIVTSEEAGVEKPDERMFTMILDKLDVSPSEALYIGDSLKKDVNGAEAVGIDVLWYNGKEEDPRSVRSFREVLERVSL
jgi:putative hydrolase of the HAD superfamily